MNERMSDEPMWRTYLSMKSDGCTKAALDYIERLESEVGRLTEELRIANTNLDTAMRAMKEARAQRDAAEKVAKMGVCPFCHSVEPLPDDYKVQDAMGNLVKMQRLCDHPYHGNREAERAEVKRLTEELNEAEREANVDDFPYPDGQP